MEEQIKPAKKKFYKRWWFWVIAVVALFIIIGASGNSDKNNTVQNTETKTENMQNYTFDIPSLIGKNVDEVKSALGTPSDDTEPTAQQSAGAKEWSKTFKKDGQELLVTYKPSDRSIIDYFITAHDSSNADGLTKNTKQLLQIGNLKDSDPAYKIEFVKALKDQSSYTGLKITPTK